MKTFLCCIGFCCFYSIMAIARPPQKIYSISRQNLSADYYFKQAALWKAELDLELQNSEAWFNYFMANHILLTKGKTSLSELEQINAALQKSLPESFEAYFAKYSIQKDIRFLLKAYELAPNRYETYADWILHYKANLQEKKVVLLCQKWLASGEYSNGLLHWNYNMLVGLTQNSILLTEGDNYTQPYIGFRVFMEVLEEGTHDKIRKGMIGPPGTLHLSGNLYMDEHELTNIDWQEYTYWIKKNEPDQYSSILLDTNAWSSLGTAFAPLSNNIIRFLLITVTLLLE